MLQFDKSVLIEHLSPPKNLKNKNTDQYFIAMTLMQMEAYKGVFSV